MSNEYRNNHYVPQWYQKRFIDPGESDRVLYRLDMAPVPFTDSRGVIHTPNGLRALGPKYIFVEKDLYTTQLESVESTKIEEIFFGKIDSEGRKALEYFSGFAHPSINERAFRSLLVFMGTQKLRTPKGLQWLAKRTGSYDRDLILRYMLGLRDMYSAVWTECVWQIADASESDTKFIISDHPVTVYNRRCGPRSSWCRGVEDPDVRFSATHTFFPLSLDKILILTNLTWVRNPYQSETTMRPNPGLFRDAMFKVTDIQTLRHLTEEEVRQINFITKTRAHRYVAAGKAEWLHPEKFISKRDWFDFGNGYLLMPDPRPVVYSTGVMIGFRDGSATSFDAYGRRPWDEGDSFSAGTDDEYNTLEHFKGEFATLFGPDRRGRTFSHLYLDPETDTDKTHKYHLGLIKWPYGYKKRRGR